MDKRQNARQFFACPMHSDVRQPGPGKCSKCGMDLLPEGTRFALVRHMMSSPLHGDDDDDEMKSAQGHPR